MSHARRVTLFVLLTLVIQLGCWLLWQLSQFGQAPFARLPTIVLITFGALFAGVLRALVEPLTPRSRAVAAFLAVLANLALSSVLGELAPGGERYLLAPLAAVALSLLYPILFGARAALVGAMTVYIACTVLANYTFDSFLPLPGYGLVNVGTLFFGITFTQRDRVHRYGRGWAYLMIFLAALLNVVTALGLGTPLRYVAVGFAAIILSETADTEVYQRFIHRGWWTRVATSNALSIPIDTVVFTVFAFAGEAFATPAWMTEVILTDIALKFIVGFLAAVRVGWLERGQGVLSG